MPESAVNHNTKGLSMKQVRIAVLAMALAVTGCASAPKPRTDKGIDRVTYVTAFGTFGRDAYAWVARDKGFFAKQRLVVDIQPGAAGAQNVAKLQTGRAQFTAIDFGTAAYQVATGADTDLRITAAIQQRVVASIITLGRTRISAPTDLAGKTIGSVQGSILNGMFTGYARQAGLDPATVKWQYAAPAELPALLTAGKVDAVAQYLMGTPSINKAAGCPAGQTEGPNCAVVLPYDKYLGDPYGAVLVTTGTLIGRDKDLVSRFTRALLEGLAYAVAHPEESGEILHRAVPASDAPTAAAELRAMAPYVNADPVGGLSPARVARGIGSLQSIGLYPSAPAPDALVDFSVAPRTAGEAGASK
jgi:NitT/TauT family transport system substrate-binding protein